MPHVGIGAGITGRRRSIAPKPNVSTTGTPFGLLAAITRTATLGLATPLGLLVSITRTNVQPAQTGTPLGLLAAITN